MKTFIVRYTIVGVLMLGLAISGIALADDDGQHCSFQGTWFGVVSPQIKVLTGWMVTVEGKSTNYGTNNLEYPIYFDPTLGVFGDAKRISTLRGAWERTSSNTFVYTMIGVAVAEDGFTPVWIGKLNGNITLSADCNSETITATLEVFPPSVSPFDGVPLFSSQLDPHYGYRASVDLP
jgi:hypothetical protein